MGLAAPYLSVLYNALDNIHSLPKKRFCGCSEIIQIVLTGLEKLKSIR